MIISQIATRLYGITSYEAMFFTLVNVLFSSQTTHVHLNSNKEQLVEDFTVVAVSSSGTNSGDIDIGEVLGVEIKVKCKVVPVLN
jgi:hypothetical protein